MGATAQMANNNHRAGEGGVLAEILVENPCLSPDGNAVLIDTVLPEKVVEVPNITLFLNTSVIGARKDGDRIRWVTALCSQNSTWYGIAAPLVCDAAGLDALAYLADAALRMRTQRTHGFGEPFAPEDTLGCLVGHATYFDSKDASRPVRFVPLSYVLDITRIPRYRSFNTREQGCRLWWIEYAGRLDPVYDSESVRWELWKVVCRVWYLLKTSGEFPQAETLTSGGWWG